MRFTEKDISICKMVFNEATHEMGMLMYGDRAKEIYNFFCNKSLEGQDFFDFKRGDAFERMLRKNSMASFFFENNLVDFDCFSGEDIYYIFGCSPIAEKIWDSGKLDPYLYKLNNLDIDSILEDYPIAEKIKASGKLNKI